MAVTHPDLLWAQRSSDSDADKNIIYLTISAAELDPDFTLTIQGNKISFSGKSRGVSSKGTAADVDAKEFKFEYELFGDVDEVRRGLTGKGVQVVLRKKELSEEYWPRLTKEKGKNSRISTDWSKWVDEDEQDGEAAADDDFGAGGMPQGGGMPGMGGAGGMDFASMMGGMGGMGGAGGAGGAGGMDLASMMGGMGGMGGAGGAGGMDFAKMMEQMKAAGVGGGEGDEAPEGDSSDDEGPPPLEEA